MKGNSRQSGARPPLQLSAHLLDPPPYRELRPGDDFYEMAVFAYLLQDRLGDADRIAMFSALARDWPTGGKGGRPRSREWLAVRAFTLWRRTPDIREVAAAMHRDESDVSKLVKTGRDIVEAQYTTNEPKLYWRVESNAGPGDGPVFVAPLCQSAAERHGGGT
jgi:hypothetical protein